MRWLALALLPLATLATAQVPRGPVIASFGACATRQAPGLARSLMATELDSAEERRAARQLFQGNNACMRDRLVLSARTGEIRGAVAEALIEGTPALASRLAAIPARPAQRATVAQGRAFVANYARCLADADPAKSIALLATEHQSQAEIDAFMAFGDSLNDCMPMGLAYRIDRSDVRNHIAAHLYRVATSGGTQ